MSNGTWLMMDFEAGECELSQVGSPKPQSAPTTDDPDMTASAQLKRDAMLAYTALGGPEYLRRNPELLDKTLLKMVAEPEQKVDGPIRLEIIAPWMDGQSRLSYQREPEYLKLAAAEVIELAPQSTPPNKPDEIAQARAEHEAAQIKAKDKDKAIKARRAGTAHYQRAESNAVAVPLLDTEQPPAPGIARAVEASIAAKAKARERAATVAAQPRRKA